MFRVLPPKLEHLLGEFDIYGSPGTPWCKDRHHVLLHDVECEHDHSKFFNGVQTAVEGGSLAMFQDGCFPNLCDRTFGGAIQIEIPHDMKLPQDRKLLLWNVVDSHAFPLQSQAAWVVDHATMILPTKDPVGQCIHVFEAFSGGYGGWKVACNALKDLYNIPIMTMALDESLDACCHYAMMHNAVVVEATNCKPEIDVDKLTCDVVIHADADDDVWVPIAARWGIHIMTVSAPCPPWSGASSGPGLHSDIGCLLPAMILRCRQLRPKVVLLEQVQGFSTHQHKRLCLDVLKHVGYQILWQRVLDSAEFGCVTRIRWLAIAVRRHASDVEIPQFENWPKVEQLLPDILKSVFASPVPDTIKLRTTQEMISCAMDTTMLPPVLKEHRNKTGKELLKMRCKTGSEVFPTIMARYGMQHALNRSTLETKGYYGHFFQDEHNQLRLLHPAEIHMCHITYGCSFVTNDLQKSWEHAGNMITCPHALLLLIHGIKALKNLKSNLDLTEVFHTLLQNRLRADESDHFTSQTAQFFVPKNDRTRDWQKHLQAFDVIDNRDDHFRLQPHHSWHPEHGLIHNDTLMHPETAAVNTSQITLPTEIDEDEPVILSSTVPFQPMLRIQILTEITKFELWAVSNVRPCDLSWQFDHQFKIEECVNNPDGFAMLMTRQIHLADLETCDTFATPCINEGRLLFIQLDVQKPIQKQLDDLGLSGLTFDQFGIVAVGQQFTFRTMMMNFRILHKPLDQHACMVLAAYKKAQMSFLSDTDTLSVCFNFTGEDTPVKTMMHFWANVLDAKTRDHLKMTTHTQLLPNGGVVTYSSSLPIPASAIARILSIAATRQIFDTLSDPNGTRVILKWQSKAIWDGLLVGDVNAQLIGSLLQLTCFPELLGRDMRMIHKAKQCCNVSIEQLLSETHANFVMIQLMKEMSGGAGTKDNQKTYVRNSLAATLLEQGFPFNWVSEATEKLVALVGLKQITQVSNSPPGKQRLDSILQLCEQCELSPPLAVSKSAQKVAQVGMNKARKRVAINVNPADYRIEPSFFLAENDEKLPQLHEIRHKSCGVMLMSFDQALPWLREQQIISADELAMVILGHHENLQTTLKTQCLHVPCQDSDSRPVILKATLVQLGEKVVRTHVSEMPIIDEQSCSTVSITYWKEDWSVDEWKQIVDQPFSYARQILAAQGLSDLLQSTWGKSVRKDRMPTTSYHATSVQFHATIAGDRILEALNASGFNKLWLTPKNNQGRLDTSWRIVWVEGSIAHLTSLASKTSCCAGLVKNQKSMGLRFSSKDFDRAWAVIFPGKEAPKVQEVHHMFQLQSLPYGTTAAMLEQWANNIGWTFKAIKALGPNSWLIGSCDMPPPGLQLFNDRPILIKHLPPKDTANRNPIVAGPMPRKVDRNAMSSASMDQTSPHFDPWAGYNANKMQPAQPKDLTGPTEAKFQEHAAKLNSQGEQIQKIEKALMQLQSDTKQEFQNVQQREQQTQMQMQAAINAVKTDLESSFQQAISQQSLQLNSTLGELRTLLQAKPKRTRSADGDDGMEG